MAAAVPVAAAAGPPGWAALAATAALTAGGSALASWLSNKGQNKETKMERTKRKLVDQLLNSLQGSGPFSDLYKFDEDSFNKSFVEPAQARFKNQIAPQIQQQYIASGQQRGTGLDDTLTRAGVDLDQMLNQYYMQYQESAKNRAQSGINSIFSQGSGAQTPLTGGEAAMQGAGGFFTSDAWKDIAKGASQNFNTWGQQNPADMTPDYITRKGFTG